MTQYKYDLRTGWPNLKVVPKERLATIATDVILSERGLQYTSNELLGKVNAREQIAKMLSHTFTADKQVNPQNLMITTGALTAIDIICRTLTTPGDMVVVENPTFFFVLNILKMSRVQVTGIPISQKTQGIDLDRLEHIAIQQQHKLKLVYTIPSFHNPTGYCATDSSRRELVTMANKYGFKILEDSTYQGLYYRSQPPPMLRTFDSTGNSVFTVGSVSKVLMPSLRVGWLLAENQWMQQFLPYKSDTVTSSLTSEIVADFLQQDDRYHQMTYARTFYSGKYKIALDVLKTRLPDWVDWFEPDGGFFFWLQLPKSIDIDILLILAHECELDFLPGSKTAVGSESFNAIRICFAYLEDEDLKKALNLLCDLLHRVEVIEV